MTPALLYPTHLTYRRIDAAHDLRPGVLTPANDTCARCGNALCDCFDAHWTPRVIESARNTSARPQVTLLPKQGPGAFSILLHDGRDAGKGLQGHVRHPG